MDKEISAVLKESKKEEERRCEEIKKLKEEIKESRKRVEKAVSGLSLML